MVERPRIPNRKEIIKIYFPPPFFVFLLMCLFQAKLLPVLKDFSFAWKGSHAPWAAVGKLMVSSS